MCIRPGYALRPAASWTYADCVQQAGLRPLPFCVEAGVHVSALDRKGREQRVRYCLRPAIAHERLSILKDGSVAYL
jgi:hypothetical protein